MIHNREWQKSSAISGALWALNTILIYKLVSQLGHGWQLNMAVSLTADAVMYGFNKLWVWRKRKASLRGSAGWSFIWWVLFFGLNTGLAWLLMSQIDLGTLWARGSLGLIGFAMNPIVFKFRDKMAFKRSTRMTEMA
ncbi:MAG TPA: hypothetical protein VLE51_03445 [Candidatus Saccharimonadales bacterium]|nr:hypothetical protein [Candidatus Saccharimonadales bacterium]